METKDEVSAPNKRSFSAILSRNRIRDIAKCTDFRSSLSDTSSTSLRSGEYASKYKIILLGDSAVGKSNLLLRFTRNSFFTDHKPTIGVEFFSKTVQIQNNKLVRAQIWDTAGQERYQFIASSYYRESVGALLVYDVTNRKSFDHIPKWLKEVELHCDENCLCILVGNKCDLEESQRQVSDLDGKAFAEKNGMAFIETSALTAVNVAVAFHKLIQKIYSVQENLEKQKEGQDEILSTVVGVQAKSLFSSDVKLDRLRSNQSMRINGNGNGVQSRKNINLKDAANEEDKQRIFDFRRCCGYT